MSFFSPRLKIRYQRAELLGEGSFSSVYRVVKEIRPLGLRQVVAAKILKCKTSVEILRKELDSLTRVDSQHCVKVLGFESWDGRPALLLEYVEGLSLDLLMRRTWLSAEEINEICQQIQRGLNDLAEEGLFHGDLSPKNVLVSRKGRVKLIDFGFGNHCLEGTFLTEKYAAPERLQGKAPNLAMDQVSLNLIRNELLEWSGVANVPAVSDSKVVRRKIAEKVAFVSESEKKQTTAYFEPLRMKGALRFPRCLPALLIAAYLPLVSATRVQLTAPAILQIRGNKWREVFLDQQRIGYIPSETVISQPGRHQIRWRSAGESGVRVLTLRPGQNKVLTEDFFNSMPGKPIGLATGRHSRNRSRDYRVSPGF